MCFFLNVKHDGFEDVGSYIETHAHTLARTLVETGKISGFVVRSQRKVSFCDGSTCFDLRKVHLFHVLGRCNHYRQRTSWRNNPAELC